MTPKNVASAVVEAPMMNDKEHWPPEHPQVNYGRRAVLLVNLGTPDGLDFWSIRRYLKEFLSDRRVIEANPVIWSLVLNLIILTFRPKKAGHAYAQIWRKEENESPLRYFTREQARKLDERFPGVKIEWAMRYGQPSIKEKINELKAQGFDRIAVIPLYPQYSATTTATVNDEVFRVLMKMRWQPTVRIAAPYFDHPAFIEALAKLLKSHIASLDWEPDMVVNSFHGLPQEYFDKGDPYHCHCHKNSRLLREAMGMDADHWRLAFQSRFGPKAWLQPYMDKTVVELAQQGVKKLVVITPGFASDCVETLEEIAIGVKEMFIEAGGTHFSVVPCLNDSDIGVDMLQALVEQELQGWD